MISQHWQLWGPVEPAYNVTQPWVKGHNGEYYTLNKRFGS